METAKPKIEPKTKGLIDEYGDFEDDFEPVPNKQATADAGNSKGLPAVNNLPKSDFDDDFEDPDAKPPNQPEEKKKPQDQLPKDDKQVAAKNDPIEPTKQLQVLSLHSERQNSYRLQADSRASKRQKE